MLHLPSYWVLLVSHGLAAAAHPTGFPPGWNKLATKPPMGWRSWNAYGNRVSQDLMIANMDALTAKVWTVGSKKNQSLLDVGYSSAGVDEGWEGCGQGVNGTQHDEKGNPVINKKFPDMKSLVAHGHQAGLKVGFYENGCACGERHALPQNYEGDVRVLHDLNFDGVKLDGCGAQKNMTLYASLMQATGKNYLIENCHWGRCTGSDDSSCPTETWCPFNWFRTSGDINSSPLSWLGNLQTTIAFQDPVKPLSVPGCWAYPDMLEVGRIKGADGKLDVPWNRAHFGAWCVISAPLILGLDLTSTATLAPVIDIVTNEEAIAVNQAWAGHPGRLVWSDLGGAFGFPAARACNLHNPSLRQVGWSLRDLSTAGNVQLVAPGGGCLKVQGHGYPGGAAGLVIVSCNSSDSAQTFTWDKDSTLLKYGGHCVDVHSGGPIVWMYGCSQSSPNDKLFVNASGTVSINANGKDICFGVEASDPAGSTFASTLQAWAKPLPGDQGLALLLINPDATAHTFEVPLWTLPLTGSATNLTGASFNVRDIWAHADQSPMAKGTSALKISVNGLDSSFLRLYPNGEVVV